MNSSDEAFQKAYYEAQNKLGESNRQLSQVKQQLSMKEREKRISALTNKELSALPPTSTTYKSVGKMFVQTDIQELTKDLSTRIIDFEREGKALERASAKIERDILDHQNILKDLITQRT